MRSTVQRIIGRAGGHAGPAQRLQQQPNRVVHLAIAHLAPLHRRHPHELTVSREPARPGLAQRDHHKVEAKRITGGTLPKHRVASRGG